MPTFLGATPLRLCDGVSRRDFLQLGQGPAGRTLAELLRLKARGAVHSRTGSKASNMPLQARIADKLALARNMKFNRNSHDPFESFSGFRKPAEALPDHTGRPVPLVADFEPIRELL